MGVGHTWVAQSIENGLNHLHSPMSVNLTHNLRSGATWVIGDYELTTWVIGDYELVGGIPTPLKNMKVS